MSPPASRRAAAFLVLPAVLALSSTPSPGRAQTTCEPCHGELELLRQHASTLDAARELYAPAEVLAASAHGQEACTSCHEGFAGRFPHADAARTVACATCHEEEATTWEAGIHAEDGNALCADCHGVHDVRTAEELRTPEGDMAVRAACASCHFEPRIPPDDPHADSTSCAGCHEPHRTLPASDHEARIHVTNQGETCGECHEDVARTWADDVHARAVPERSHPGPGEVGPPACTACHGAHGMLTPSTAGFAVAAAERCAGCHEEYAETFADSYHGQATRLGSERTAGCYDCHSAHAIHPASDPRSTVSEERLLETCRTCHPAATAGFTGFQPHADPHDVERYPIVAWSYRLMTALLVGVFGVFGAHTLLWLGRLTLDGLRRPDPSSPRDERRRS